MIHWTYYNYHSLRFMTGCISKVSESDRVTTTGTSRMKLIAFFDTFRKCIFYIFDCGFHSFIDSTEWTNVRFCRDGQNTENFYDLCWFFWNHMIILAYSKTTEPTWVKFRTLSYGCFVFYLRMGKRNRIYKSWVYMLAYVCCCCCMYCCWSV